MKKYCSECAKPIKEDNGIHMFTELMRSQFVCNACYEDYKKKENVKVKKSVDLYKVSQRVAELVLKEIEVDDEEIGTKKWDDFRENILNDLIATDTQVFEENIANIVADQIHQSLSESAWVKLGQERF